MSYMAPLKTPAELEAIERVFQGRWSLGQPLLEPGVGIAFGIFAGANLPITLAQKRIGAPAAAPGVCTCVDCLRIPINQRQPYQEQKEMALSETETKITQIMGVTAEQFIGAKTKRTAIAQPETKVRERAMFIGANSDDVDITDAESHEPHVAAGRKSLAAYDASNNLEAKKGHLEDCAHNFLAASQKLSRKCSGAAHSIRFAK